MSSPGAARHHSAALPQRFEKSAMVPSSLVATTARLWPRISSMCTGRPARIPTVCALTSPGQASPVTVAASLVPAVAQSAASASRCTHQASLRVQFAPCAFPAPQTRMVFSPASACASTSIVSPWLARRADLAGLHRRDREDDDSFALGRGAPALAVSACIVEVVVLPVGQQHDDLLHPALRVHRTDRMTPYVTPRGGEETDPPHDAGAGAGGGPRGPDLHRLCA